MNASVIMYQLLPLLAYIVVDAIINKPLFSISSAIIISFAQFGVEYYRTGTTDWFILLDVGLILILGIVSLVIKNELIFKMKPAIIEAVFTVFLAVLVFMPDVWLCDYMNRYSMGMSIDARMVPAVRLSLVITVIFILLHILAVIYTARHSSKKLWAIISGPGLYLVFIPIMMYVLPRDLVRKRRALREEPSQQ